MPKVGLRTIKTAIAVFICLLLFIVVLGINYAVCGTFVGATKWYTPFFAALAAAYSVAPSMQSSIHQAKTRIVASLIGGLIGILAVFLYVTISNTKWPFSLLNSRGESLGEFNNDSYLLSLIIPSFIVGLCTIIVIYLCSVFKQKQASFVSVLTLTAVMCSLGTDPVQYGFTRILSTIIGVCVALLVNLFHIPRFKNKNRLFIVGIDGYYVSDSNKIDGYAKQTLNSLSYFGANISLITTRTPTTFMPMLEGVELNCPIICMSGSALYDTKTKKYIYTEKIDSKTTHELKEMCKSLDITPIINLIDEDVLYSYCKKVDNEGIKDYVEQRRNSAYSCYVPYESLSDDCLYMVLVIKDEQLQFVLDSINKNLKDKVMVLTYDYFEISGSLKGYKYVKIFSSKINDLNVLNYLGKYEDKVALIMHDNDAHIIDNVDYSVTTINSCKDEFKFDEVIKNNNIDGILKKVKKIFHKRKL